MKPPTTPHRTHVKMLNFVHNHTPLNISHINRPDPPASPVHFRRDAHTYRCSHEKNGRRTLDTNSVRVWTLPSHQKRKEIKKVGSHASLDSSSPVPSFPHQCSQALPIAYSVHTMILVYHFEIGLRLPFGEFVLERNSCKFLSKQIAAGLRLFRCPWPL